MVVILHEGLGEGGYDVVDLDFNPNDAFHEYGFDWYPDRIEFFVDEERVSTLTVNVPSAPGTILFNHWSNGDPLWSAGPPLEDAVLDVRAAALCTWTEISPWEVQHPQNAPVKLSRD